MQPGRYRFGLFELDSHTLELRHGASAVHLQAQPRQVLGCLVKNADRIVTRDELRSVIWGSETFVDFERGLNFCISQIRSVLKDDAARPLYIRTFARQGYRFIAPVEFIPAAAPAPVTESPRSKRGLAWLAAAALLLTAVAFAAGYTLRSYARSRSIPVVAVLRFDNETGNSDLTRFSDGLTDNVVERLTALSNGRYAVIGNAQVLRVPRNQRDLRNIAAQLHASYIVLGQVQAHEAQTRVLVHLIHMPEQTHIWVHREERTSTNPLDFETETAQRVADDFSPRITPIPPKALASSAAVNR